MENEYKIVPAETVKNVVVVGGGVSGCEAAIVAAQRGHKVTILEKSHELGGQWIAAAIPVGKGDFTTFTVWQKNMIQKLGIQVVFGVEADKAVIDSFNPDAVILAYGSNASVPPVPGLKEYGVLAEDILRGRKDFGKKVVVIGGGLVGAETADHLAAHGATDVSIVEMMPVIVADGEDSVVYYLNKRFKEAGVHVYTSAKVSMIAADHVSFTQNEKENTIDQVDTIVIATGRRSDATLADSLDGAAYQVVTVGDAKKAKQGYIDIREGYEAGLNI
ncbi:MAG: FAD-dependent oxidoreductase [Lachnospiraceae bacterium]|nr:FAD-dependent oxidoreductase [Lachnospiraceae bacterium]